MNASDGWPDSILSGDFLEHVFMRHGLAVLLAPTHQSRRSISGDLNSDSCAGFWMPAITRSRHAELTGVQKAPRHEVAESWAPAGQRALWGFDVSAEVDGGCNAARKRSGCVDRRGGEPAMGLSASARSASAGALRIDRRDRVERDHCRHRASASERESRDVHSRPGS